MSRLPLPAERHATAIMISTQFSNTTTQRVSLCCGPASEHGYCKFSNSMNAPSCIFRSLVFAISLVAGSCALSSSAYAEDPYVLWATSAAPGNVWATALSPAGELYVCNYNFGPECALLRFDQQGHVIETNQLQGVRLARLTFDTAGNRYLTGKVETNGVFSVSQVRGFFVAKYNAQNALLWVRSQGLQDTVDYDTSGAALAVDGAGNVLVASVSPYSMTFGQGTIANSGGIFVCKYDPDGQLLWARRVASGGGVNDLSLDVTGHFVIGGFLSQGTVNFSGTNVFAGSTGYSYDGDWYLARFRPNGDLYWVRLGYGGSTVTDRAGNSYASQSWSKDVVANGLVKFSSSGDMLWSKSFQGVLVQWPGGIALDPNDEPVFTGQIFGAATFGSITLDEHTSTISYGDILLAKANAQGDIQWAIHGGGTEFDRGEQVVCDRQGSIFLTGVIRRDEGNLGDLPLVPLPNDYGRSTIIAAKLSQAPPLNLTTSGADITLSWPAKATDYVLEAAVSPQGVTWEVVTNEPAIGTVERSVELPLTGNARFFRLRQP